MIDKNKTFILPPRSFMTVGGTHVQFLENEDLADEIEKHLPMQHNQKAHGRPGQVSADLVRGSIADYNAASKRIFGKVISIEILGDIYSGGLDRLPGGVKIKIDVSAATGDITVLGEIILDGKSIGKFERGFSKDRLGTTVGHVSFFLNKKYQGSGYGSGMFFHSEDAYKKLGMDRITTSANADVGGYAWARMGFDFAFTFERNDIAEKFTNAIRRKSRVLKAERQMFEKELAKIDKFKYPFQFAAYKLEYGGKILVDGKQLMKGTEWSGVKYLRMTRGPSSEAANVFRRLIGEKKLAWKKQ